MTTLGGALFGTTTVSSTPYVPLSTDTFLLVNVGAAAVVNLPSAASRAGYPLTIKDISGAASTNNITINRNGTDTIDGLTAVTLNVDYQGYSLHPITGGWALRP